MKTKERNKSTEACRCAGMIGKIVVVLSVFVLAVLFLKNTGAAAEQQTTKVSVGTVADQPLRAAACAHKNKKWVTTKKSTCTSGGHEEYRCMDCGLVFDGHDTPSNGGHVWGVTGSRDSTCTSTGYISYRCSRCGDTKSDTIGVKAHSYAWVTTKTSTCTQGGHEECRCTVCGLVIDGHDTPSNGGHVWGVTGSKDSTCTSTGYTSYRCSRCGDTKSDTIGLKSHNYAWVTTKKSSCTEGGHEERKCTVCGHVIDGHDTPSNGGHKWDVTGSKASTCTATGYTNYKCAKCGETYSETIPKKDHTYKSVTVQEPSCAAPGREEDKCTMCGHVIRGRDIPVVVEHTWKLTKTTNATCTADGSKLYTCSVCGKTKSETIAALGHLYAWVRVKEPTCIEVGKEESKCSRCGHVATGRDIQCSNYSWKVTSTTPATCTTNGVRTRKCSYCGKTKQETYENATGHTYTWVETKKPTCSEAGKEENKCTKCGHVIDGHDIPILKHTWKVTSTTPATCTANGVRNYKCTACGKTTKETIKATGHTYKWTQVKDPTCTEAGKEEYKCTKCGHVINGHDIPVVKHTWKVTSTTAATCTTNGYRNYVCTVCGKTTKETIEKATGHTYAWTKVKDPTCSEAGKEESKCTKCGHVVNGREIPTIKHTWKITSTKAATCTATGLRNYVCTVCGKTTKETIKALGHSYTWVETKKPTCSEAGKEESKCTRCGHVIDGHDIPTIKHTWKVTATKPATCTTNGVKDYVCTVCGKTTKATFETAAGHTYKWVTVKKPGCTTAGKEEYKCTKCGHVMDGHDIPAQHTWKVTNTVEATCTATGRKDYVCTVCGKTTKMTLAKKEHTGTWVTVTNPTSTTVGKENYVCSVCKTVVSSRALYRVALYYNDGTNRFSTEVKSNGVAIKLTFVPSRTGYSFQGWSTSRTATTATIKKDSEFTANANTELYAVWKADLRTVTFNLNGGHSGAPDPITVGTGTNVTIPKADARRCEYEFLGWSDSSTASTANYPAGKTFAVKNNITLYAVWKKSSDPNVGHMFTRDYQPQHNGQNHNEYCALCKKWITTSHSMHMYAMYDGDMNNGSGYHINLCVNENNMLCGYSDFVEYCVDHVPNWTYYSKELKRPQDNGKSTWIIARTGTCSACGATVMEMTIIIREKKISLSELLFDGAKILVDIASIWFPENEGRIWTGVGLVGSGIEYYQKWKEYLFQQSLDPRKLNMTEVTDSFLTFARSQFNDSADDDETFYFYDLTNVRDSDKADYCDHSHRPTIKE